MRNNVNSSIMDFAKEALLTVKEVAGLIGVSERTVWKLTHEGRLQSIRIGRAVRYRLADVNQMIETNRRVA